MEKIHKIIVMLLIIAIVFSAVSVLLNLSLINFEFKPINVTIPSNVPKGTPEGNIRLIIEKNPSQNG